MSEENAAVSAGAPDSASAEPMSALQTLKPHTELRGVVKRVELAGAFIDVGLGKDAFVHISQLSESPVKNVDDVLREGQQVTVWVRQVDAERGLIDVTMIKPIALPWDEIQVGQVLTGKIVRIESYGVFIDVGAERPGMVHVKELSYGFTGSPESVYKIGDELTAKVIKVSSRKKQIDLSVKALETPPATKAADDEDEDDENVPNAIELALRRALLNAADADFPELERVLEGRGANKTISRKAKRRNKRSARPQQEEALSSGSES